MMKRLSYILFFALLCALLLALVFTIFGSSTGHDGLLAAGIIGWFATTCLLFALVVLAVWTGRKRYER